MTRRSLARLLKVSTFSIVACNGQLLVEEDPTAGGEPFAGNAADCPGAQPESGAQCGVAEGQVCAFDTADLYNAGYVNHVLCGCWEASSSARKWHCYGGSSGPWQCPSAEPSRGQSCYGLYGAECTYPERSVCNCSSRSGTWSCSEEGRDDIPAPPSLVPSGQPIDALTDEERAEWCDWYATTFVGPGYPERPDAAVDADGYTVNTGCNLGWEFPCLGLVPNLSTADCEANLGLSSCAAPISELSDCLVTVIDGCWPSPHGCGRYLDKPGCDGTIVVSNTLGTDGGSGGTTSTGGSTSTGGVFMTGGTGTGGRSGLAACSVRVR